jgi:hypothetical protein
MAMGAGTAHAQLIASFSYENLVSSYDAGAQVLSTTIGADSTGSVSRLLAPAGTADFDVGSAAYSLDLNVSAVGIDGAMGSGSMVATDLNGDTLTANVDGEFSFVPIGGSGLGAIFFDGALSDVFFNDNSGDGMFDGDTSSFGLDFSDAGPAPYSGGIQRLQISDVMFFDQDFGNRLAEVDGQIVPAPGALGLLGLGLLASRRRR